MISGDAPAIWSTIQAEKLNTNRARLLAHAIRWALPSRAHRAAFEDWLSHRVAGLTECAVNRGAWRDLDNIVRQYNFLSVWVGMGKSLDPRRLPRDA